LDRHHGHTGRLNDDIFRIRLYDDLRNIRNLVHFHTHLLHHAHRIAAAGLPSSRLQSLVRQRISPRKLLYEYNKTIAQSKDRPIMLASKPSDVVMCELAPKFCVEHEREEIYIDVMRNRDENPRIRGD
jgi:hypothetical protein